MATSGYFNTSSVGGSFYFTFSWSRTGYDATKNEHYIYYELIAHNTPGKYRTVWLKNLWVNGSQVFYQAGTSANGVSYYDGNKVTSGNITVPSYDSAGNGSFSASFEAGVGQYPSSNCSGNGSWDLDRIPRYTSFTNHSISATTLNSFTVSWSAADTCSNVYYSFNGGDWTWCKGESSSGTYTISGQAADTSFSIRTKVIRKDSGLETISGYLYPKTKAKATLSDVGAITLPAPGSTVNATFNITNNSSQTATVYLEKNSSGNNYGASTTFTTGTTGAKTLTLPAATVNKLYTENTTVDSIAGMQLTAQTAESSTYYDRKTIAINFSADNAGPTAIAACTYLDTNENARALTGSSSSAVSSGLKIIPGYSNVQINVPANPLTLKANSGATQGTVSIAGFAAESSTTARSKTVSKATATSYNIVATDSRGFPKTRTMTVTSYPYTALTITSFEATRDSSDNTKGTYKLTGTYQNSNYGGISHNLTFP